MRQAFTLIELMIVIAIIAIIAAIAIPNLLESRITANESASAASLKSGIFPGQVQFQAGAYSDVDGNGRGEYTNDVKYLSGTTSAATTNTGDSPKALNLISPTFTVGDGAPVGAYLYQCDVATTGSLVAGDQFYGESYFAAYSSPNAPGNDGRRAFGINSYGAVFSTRQTLAMTSSVIGLAAVCWPNGAITGGSAGAAPTVAATNANASSIFKTNPQYTNAVNNSTYATPYIK